MLKFKRPEKPANFEENAQTFRGEVILAIENEEKPEFKDNFWKSLKVHFAQAQNGKCGYCEMRIIGAGFGDVEHYAPKSEVWELDPDPTTWGEEANGLSNVSGRKPNHISERGYWWKAYEWENYLFACAICNQSWKSAIFPVQENPRKIPPDENSEETPLLLNPYSRRNPSKHLKFNDIGAIEALENSPFGRETIKTCGLDRESLVLSRKNKAQWVHRLIQEINETTDDEEIERKLEDIRRLGDDSEPHAGMVRIIFEQITGIEWDQIQ